MKLLVVLLLSVFISSNAQAQVQKQQAIDGREAIKLLSEGTLIVRLSKSESYLENIKATEGEEKAIQEEKRIDQANRKIIKEFEKDYSFSDVVYAYEVELYEYLKDPSKKIFLDKELNTNTRIKIRNEPIFILASYTNKVFQLHDKNLNLIGNPSPKYSNNYFNREYKFIVAKVMQKISNLFILDRPVSDFNKKLFTYLER